MSSRITPFLIIALALVLTLVYTRPTWAGDIAESRARIASYDAALGAADRFQEKEAELTRQQQSIAPEDLARLQAFLPDDVNNVQLILDLDALAARSGVTLSDFTVTAPGEEGASSGDSGGSLTLSGGAPYDSVDLTLTATGSYGAFRRFLTGVEQSLRVLDVVGLGLEESDSGIYTYSLTVRIYWLR